MASAALSRADVLRVLEKHDAAAVARIAALCGFQQQAPTVTIELGTPIVPPEPEQVAQSTTPMLVAPLEARPPLQARLFQAWVTETPHQTSERSELAPLQVEDLLPDPHATLPPKAPLVRAAQLWPALKNSLRKAVAGDLDPRVLVEQIARTQRWDPLPQLHEQIWRAPLWVIWDQAERLTPYQDDYQALYRLLLRMRGQSELMFYSHYDDGSFKRWHQRGGEDLRKLPRPAPGTNVLVLSDLGALATSAWQEQRWLQRLREWRCAGADVLAWLPSAPGQVSADLAKAASVRHLCEPGRMRPQRRGWRDLTQRHVLQQQLRVRLLSVTSCALHLSPELLRMLRMLDPVLRHEPGAEALVWDSREVGCSQLSRPLNTECAPAYRAAFGTLPIALQRQVLQCLRQHHATRGQTTLWLEQLLWQTHSHGEAHTEATTADSTHARSALQRLSHAGAGSELEEDIARFARDVCGRQQHDARWWRAEGDWATDLLQLAAAKQAPTGLTPKQALDITRRRLEQRCYLAQRGEALWLLPASQRVPVAQRLSDDFTADQLVLELPTGLRNFTIFDETQEIHRPMQAMRVQTRGSQIDIAEITRPAWAHEFGRDKGGIYALGAPLGTRQYKRYVSPPEHAAAGNPFFLRDESSQETEWPVAQASWRLGIDLEFGNFAELHLGEAVQRFRWIEAGEFLMGSPENEPERDEDEGPQHRVRISEGFWLADTTCTQALWLAVTGRSKNPSYIQGNGELPVEQVSFFDVQEFISCLNVILPEHVEAELPNEAQWEYACRAGTQTPFSFGESIDSTQVNFNDRGPYQGSPMGTFRQRTVQVSTLDANRWGLFEMHGNLWEWCRDAWRQYEITAPGQATVDPLGSLDSPVRALRGGAWFSSAKYTRSAFRDRNECSYRNRGVGFRLSLRSLSRAVLEGRPRNRMPQMPKSSGTGLTSAGQLPSSDFGRQAESRNADAT